MTNHKTHLAPLSEFAFKEEKPSGYGSGIITGAGPFIGIGVGIFFKRRVSIISESD